MDEHFAQVVVETGVVGAREREQISFLLRPTLNMITAAATAAKVANANELSSEEPKGAAPLSFLLLSSSSSSA